MIWSVSPLLAIALLTWAQVRILRRADERERLTQLGAMAFGFGVVIVAWVCALAVSERRGS